MTHKRTTSHHFTAVIALLLALFICAVPPAARVYALPAPTTGWVEVQCSPVPEDFSDTATVVLSNTETGEYYTITCHKVNDYIGRLQLPTGKYQVEQTSTADNFAYEASTETSTFEITPDMPAAQLITLAIIKHDVSYELPPTEELETTDASETEMHTDLSTQEGSDNHTESNAQDISNAVLDWIAEESAPDSEIDSASAEVMQSEEVSEFSYGKRVVFILLGTALFILFIMIISCFARLHYEQD